MKITSIYPGYMGEVNRFGIGMPCTFVRLSGCNLRCYKSTKGFFCDTPEALNPDSGVDMDLDKILDKCYAFGHNVICLTGGEPLLKTRETQMLLDILIRAGFFIVVETNGSVSLSDYVSLRKKLSNNDSTPVSHISFVVDYKLGSTGETENMRPENWMLMDEHDYLKFVIDDNSDYEQMKYWITTHPRFKGNIAAGLMWGSALTYALLMEKLQEDNLSSFVVLNMQAHKMGCLYDRERKKLASLYIPKDL
jgi:7-carboxy-7-deazaguanine synthase|nr:MAG TPA: putative 7-cyano-7-deazaguanosine (preQ0) biosynthesis protein QueE, gammaproteobacterial [Caudoviricetes sp.]